MATRCQWCREFNLVPAGPNGAAMVCPHCDNGHEPKLCPRCRWGLTDAKKVYKDRGGK